MHIYRCTFKYPVETEDKGFTRWHFEYAFFEFNADKDADALAHVEKQFAKMKPRVIAGEEVREEPSELVRVLEDWSLRQGLFNVSARILHDVKAPDLVNEKVV